MAAGHSIGKLFVELDLDPSRYMKAQQTLLKEAQSGADILEKNFKNLGIKSGASFDLMRAQAIKSFEQIKTASNVTSQDILRAEKAKNDQLKRLNEQQFGHHTGLIQGLKNNWIAATAAIYAAWRTVSAGIRLSQEIFDAGKVASQTKLAFTEIAGSAELAKDELDFLRATADKLGQNFWALIDSYKGVLAASKTTNIAGEETRHVFEAVMKASTTLGLSMDRTKLALYAIEQMMSKGKVTSEELRRQLGDVLPGAFSLAAKAMGLTTAEFDKMLREGKILSDDFLPKFAKALEEKYSGTVTESVAATNKWNEAVMDLKVTMAEGGFLEAASQVIRKLTDAIKDPSFQQGMVDFAKNMAEVAEHVASIAKYLGLRSVTGTFFEGIALSKEGLVDLDKFIKASFLERQRMVDQARSRGDIPESTIAAHGNISDGLVSSHGKMPVTTKPQIPTATSKVTAEDKAAIKEKQDLIDKLWKYEVDAAVKADKEMSDAYEQYATYEQDMKKKTAKITAEQAKAEIDLQKMLIDSMKRTDEGYFQYKWAALEQEKQKYLDLGFSKTAVEEAFARKAEDLYKEEALAHGNLIDGMKVGLMDYLDSQKTWADQGLALFNQFASSATSALSDSFFAVIKGDLDSLEDIWQSFLDTMLKAFTDMLAEMIVQWAMSGIMDLLSGKGFSGFSVENLTGGKSITDIVSSVSTAISGGKSGLSAAEVALQTGAPAVVSADLAYEAFAGTEAVVAGAETGTGALAGYAALGPVAAAILAAPVLGPTVTKYGKQLMQSFGMGKDLGPGSTDYLDAIAAGLDYVPGWEGMTSGFASKLLAEGGMEDFIRYMIKASGGFYGQRDGVFSGGFTRPDDPYGSFTPAFTYADAGPWTELLEQYKGLKSGIDFVPADGPYYLHRGERVTRAEDNKSATLTVNVPVMIDGKEIGYVVAKQMKVNPELILATRSLN